MPPEWLDWKIRIEMREYPGTGIYKAVLKFSRQGRKKSQIVSVKIPVFLCLLFRQLLPECRQKISFAGYVASFFTTDLVLPASLSVWPHATCQDHSDPESGAKKSPLIFFL